MHRIVMQTLAVAFVGCVLAGCLAIHSTASVPGYRNRAVPYTEGGIEVSTAALSPEESAAVYGVPLAGRKIQPVWIEVRNREDRSYFLLSPGLDPNFFPASEAAEAFSGTASHEQRADLDRRFRDLAFHNPIRPGETVSGFVLTNLNEGAKLVQIDLVAKERARTFSIFVAVPGFEGDYTRSEVFKRIANPQEPPVNYTDDASFRAALEALPCCATNEDGSKEGDPLNLVIVGSRDDALPALVRRDWSLTEQKWSGAIRRMIGAALSGEPYVNAPVSDLYLFGRAQDLALQKARSDIHQRNHMRLWLSNMRYHDKLVWVGQVSRDIGIRLTWHSSTFTTHKIDPDVDEARTALTEDMAYSQNLMKIGLVAGVGAAQESAHRTNLTTDPYYTDGNRVLLVFDRTPRPLSEIEIFPWITPYKVMHMTPGAKP
ncbi:LssY-like putative type I secretion system component LssY [Paraburkholderia silvatlantica]|uniref:LssY-like putative type I secretion system component LssY n=1 Tax=Paraburkholderia silvatlantica TaxID=321895 RepID=A0A2V4T7G6_9BURK|nr:LssY C-terminal domain-containing protein [Paraburkholderia silvatlantica]PYE21505.1 LssY-like putative type I secretion system component LssY [Paraburkholderia silvatlantica]